MSEEESSYSYLSHLLNCLSYEDFHTTSREGEVGVLLGHFWLLAVQLSIRCLMGNLIRLL